MMTGNMPSAMFENQINIKILLEKGVFNICR